MQTKRSQPKPCGIRGCRAYCQHGKDYCSQHQRMIDKYPDPNRQPDALPATGPQKRRQCAYPGCKRHSRAGHEYCTAHQIALSNTQGKEQPAPLLDAILERLWAFDGKMPDSEPAIKAEFELVQLARKTYLAAYQMQGMVGWKGVSVHKFLRSWLNSTTVMAELIKARYVMQRGESGELAQLIDEACQRLDHPHTVILEGKLVQQPALPLLVTPTAAEPLPAKVKDWLAWSVRTLGTDHTRLVIEEWAAQNETDQAPSQIAQALLSALQSRAHQEAPTQIAPSLLGQGMDSLEDTLHRSGNIVAPRPPHLAEVLSPYKENNP